MKNPWAFEPCGLAPSMHHQLAGLRRAFMQMAMMRAANPGKTATARKVAVDPKASHSQPARMLG